MQKLRDMMHSPKGRIVVVIIIVLVMAVMVGDYIHTRKGDSLDKRGLFQQIEDIENATTPTPKENQTQTPRPTLGNDTVIGNPKQTSSKTSSLSAVTLGFAGDICLDDNCSVMKGMCSNGEGITGSIDKRLIKFMKTDDFMVINNEFSYSNRGQKMPGKAYTFRAATKNVKYLKNMGVDAVSLANNHVFDYGKTAFLDTINTLDKADIKHSGAGKNIKEAKKPVIFTKNGVKIAIIAATRAEKYVLTPDATANSPGVFYTYDDTEYVKQIKKYSKKADIVIAYVHWGTEYSTVLESAQIQQAKDYINAGADMVVGAHTHCMQGIGSYKGKPIFYSLGNFWFNEKTLYTTLLQVSVDKDGVITAKLEPCIQKNLKTSLLTKQSKINKFIKYVNDASRGAKLNKNCYFKIKK